MSTSDLERRLAAVVAKLASEHQTSAQRDVDQLLGTGVRTYEDLLALSIDASQPATLRVLACWSLGRLGDPQAVATWVGALRDGDRHVREAAARALGELDGEEAVEPLVDRLTSERDLDVLRATVASLGLLGDRRASVPLMNVLADTKQPALLRGTAAEALSDLRDPTAVDALIAALHDAEAEVRFYAAFALGEIGDARGLPALEEVADHGDGATIAGSTVGDEAAHALAKIRARFGH